MTKIALAIAGSEASGGAGAQTDIKTFEQLGVFGATSLTCIVSFDPNNDWGHRFVPVDPQVIHDQIEAAVAVHGHIDAVKIGMLGTPTTINVVAEALKEYDFDQVIVDPVLICKGQEAGAALDTDNALRAQVMPFATMTTPNLFETQILSGMDEITNVSQLKDAAKRIHDQGVPNVLAKAGTLFDTGTALDVFYDGSTLEVLEVPAIGEERVSGAGCTLAAAVTAEIAKGATPLDAARTAKQVVVSSIEHRMHGNAPFDCVFQGYYREPALATD
ncbi:hydroxymethylpyrimidine/phosphomethylpyrimidine kinase [Propionibacterium freudenreichii]|uniref:hydroxymethylpyrimidine/phosphomethylpyrimidine kinase n=1 Tax=Propionibacterium freudenreichii TaxID=1744 RepID=UPI0021A9716B|nr:hydroxymethylpyrimidine/phosphomethylpyrimidine kinase [Propionibacterium freudenreichii]MCT2990972.1 hydroxymethylpyrimidine/phosphomethylpyrimidine kinase [Propionibacterium freudenreichii]MCT2994120.1 hydroxymethylpyrimidine/phosphomethylpyrimidine kinase [Propionibacterium freudenreichii]MDK9651362.1 hydroxymethylpyrimidine/phosphomethylpyrimidine kinase [Propionibacterium freudenreichii]MDK9664770.1 hydroxymethylpyrimidine/phosphomethylpyrimidine kinase [Propionibacterium freudenreichii